jgi:hypothetical protein
MENTYKCRQEYCSNIYKSVTNAYKGLKIFGTEIQETTTAKYVGIRLGKMLAWNTQIKATTTEAMSRFLAFCNRFSRKTDTQLYKSSVRSTYLYGALAWRCAAKSNTEKLQTIQNKIIWTACGGDRYTGNMTTHTALNAITVYEETVRACP